MAATVPFVCARCLRSSNLTQLSPFSRHSSSAMPRTNIRNHIKPLPLRISRPQSTLLRPSITANSTSSSRKPHRLYSTAQAASATLAPQPPPSPPRPSNSGATIPIWNPQFSETGDPLVVSITPRAAHRLRTIMDNDANPALCLRITVESGGCHGFQYLMSLTSSGDMSADEDTLFVYQKDGDSLPIPSSGATAADVDFTAICAGQPKIVMDSASLELLEGSKIDYTMELIGSQFKIVDNPRATSSCGCGTSFDVKI